MNKLFFPMNYQTPEIQVVEVQVECGFQISGGGFGESGLPDEEM